MLGRLVSTTPITGRPIGAVVVPTLAAIVLGRISAGRRHIELHVHANTLSPSKARAAPAPSLGKDLR